MLSQAVAAQLARETTLRSRAATWAAPDETALEAGRRLQAETVMSAVVDRSHDPWRVSAQLTRTRDAKELERLEKIDTIYPREKVMIVEYGPALGVHLGPNTMGVAVYEGFD